jgi:shikimate dehydrogenase
MIAAAVLPNQPGAPLIREAEARGYRALDGLGMLVNQRVISIKRRARVDVEPGIIRGKIEAPFGVGDGLVKCRRNSVWGRIMSPSFSN